MLLKEKDQAALRKSQLALVQHCEGQNVVS
jgi:hypothetical protein